MRDNERWVAQASPTLLRTAPIFTRLVNLCWSFFQWCLTLAIVGALAVGGYLYFRLDDEIRRQVERRLATYYRDFDVRVGGARFDADRGISISNLTFTQKVSDGTSQPVLAIEELYMAGKLRMDQLLTGQMPIDEMVIRGAKLRLVRQMDGQWNAHELLPFPHFSNESPRVKIENAAAMIEDATVPTAKPWAINGVNLCLVPVESSASADAGGKRFHVEGTATGLPAQEIRLTGEIGTTTGDYALSIAAVGLEISPELLANLPSSTTARLHGAEFSGRADLTVKLSRSAAAAAVDWSAAIKLDRGQIAHPLLPEALTDVSLVGRADSNRVLIERLNGKYGAATLALALDRAGWSENAPVALSAKVVGLTVDDRMRAALPDPYSKVWNRFKPAGLVDAEVRVTFDGQKWRPILTANCRGISLTDAEKFPYTLEQTNGRVEYHPAENGKADQLRLDLTGVGGGRPVKIKAELTHVAHTEAEGITTATGVADAEAPQRSNAYAAGYRGASYSGTSAPPHPVGFVKISGNDVPIHEQLIAAIPKNCQPLVRSLHAQGAVDFQFGVEWKDLSQPRGNATLEIQLKDCQIQFARFPYPLQHVQGRVTANTAMAKNWNWKLQDIEGRGVNDRTIVKCHGEATSDGARYNTDLQFDARDVPLDDTLKNALVVSPGAAGLGRVATAGPSGFHGARCEASRTS